MDLFRQFIKKKLKKVKRYTRKSNFNRKYPNWHRVDRPDSTIKPSLIKQYYFRQDGCAHLKIKIHQAFPVTSYLSSVKICLLLRWSIGTIQL